MDSTNFIVYLFFVIFHFITFIKFIKQNIQLILHAYLIRRHGRYVFEFFVQSLNSFILDVGSMNHLTALYFPGL